VLRGAVAVGLGGRYLLMVAAVAVPAPASAALFTWPGPAPCHTTLDACLVAVPSGSDVEIVTAGPIDENLSIFKSLTIRAAAGVRPVFAPGRYVLGGTPGVPDPAGLLVTLEGLTLTDGFVDLSCWGGPGCSFTVRRMRLLTSGPAFASRITLLGDNDGALSLDISENELHSRGNAFEPAIEVRAHRPTVVGRIQFNRLTSFGASDGSGIHANAARGSLELDVFANEVRGDFRGGAIQVGNGLGVGTGASSAPVTLRLISNVVAGNGAATGGDRNGVDIVVRDADIDVVAANNTVSGTRGGLAFRRYLPGSVGDISGELVNNLIAYNQVGLSLAAWPAIANRYNLLYGNGFDIFAPGPGTVFADPRLRSIQFPRLRPGSPAIDAADTVFIGLLLGVNGFPQVDADGMRRIIGGGTLGADIGAYEFGDTSFASSKAVPGSNYFALSHPATDSQPSVRPVLTRNFGLNGVANPHSIGAWYSSPAWYAFNQGGETMPVGAAVNVFVPGLGGGGASYAHVATAANIGGDHTRLDNAYLNGTNSALVLATANWAHSGTGVYNNHPIAVGNDCLVPGPDCWYVVNQDGAAIPVNAAFNIYAQDRSPNAYRHEVTPLNRSPDGSETTLDHFLLNGTPCAQVHVARTASLLTNETYDLRYAADRWRIFNHLGIEMPLGARFFVLVNPRQVFECTDLIFADGFE
jgi:hypothetical protein